MTRTEQLHAAHVAYNRALGVAQNVTAARAAYQAVMTGQAPAQAPATTGQETSR